MGKQTARSASVLDAYRTKIEPVGDVEVGPVQTAGTGSTVGRVEVRVDADVPSGVRRAIAATAAREETGLDVCNVIGRKPNLFDVRVVLDRSSER